VAAGAPRPPCGGGGELVQLPASAVPDGSQRRDYRHGGGPTRRGPMPAEVHLWVAGSVTSAGSPTQQPPAPAIHYQRKAA